MRLREYFQCDDQTAQILAERFDSSNPDSALELTHSERHIKILWKCLKCEQVQPATPESKKRKPDSCPVCSGRVVIFGHNDVASQHPELLEEWDDSNVLDPKTMTVASRLPVQWVCRVNSQHKWVTTVRERLRAQPTTGVGSQCPHCARLETIAKRHARNQDFHLPNGDKVPSYMKEMFVQSLDPEIPNPSIGSTILVQWECKQGHSWTSSANTFKRSKGHCAQCAVKQAPNNPLTAFPDVMQQWSPNNSANPALLSAGSAKRALWRCTYGHEWETPIYARVNGYKRYGKESGCPHCSQQVSQQEEELRGWLMKHVDSPIMTNSRSIIPPYELDMYFPEKRIAVEFNGLYWHSERFKNRNAHYEKWQKCADKGIQLIQIWEDDWQQKPEIVQRMLLRKLGHSQEPAIGARNTIPVCLTYQDAAYLLERYHIQGAKQGTLYLGLKHLDDILAVMVLTRSNSGEWTLDRYATSRTVQGGFTKLLQYAKTKLPSDVSRLATFAHHDVSDGKLYDSTGWVRDKEIPPDYTYCIQKTRVHKFNYRKKRFLNDPNLLWEEGLTETELAALNNMDRCWDSGKTRYVLHLE